MKKLFHLPLQILFKNKRNIISTTQYKEFQDKGYVHFKDYFTKDEKTTLLKAGNEIENYQETKGKWLIYYEETKDKKKLRCRIENFVPFNKQLAPLIKKIEDGVDFLLKEKSVLYKDKFNLKLAGGQG
jgi:hypothetical protein